MPSVCLGTYTASLSHHLNHHHHQNQRERKKEKKKANAFALTHFALTRCVCRSLVHLRFALSSGPLDGNALASCICLPTFHLIITPPCHALPHHKRCQPLIHPSTHTTQGQAPSFAAAPLPRQISHHDHHHAAAQTLAPPLCGLHCCNAAATKLARLPDTSAIHTHFQ